jgi:hypothetical protein
MEKAHSVGEMEANMQETNMKEIGRMTGRMEMELTLGQMEENMKENGKMG